MDIQEKNMSLEKIAQRFKNKIGDEVGFNFCCLQELYTIIDEVIKETIDYTENVKGILSQKIT